MSFVKEWNTLEQESYDTAEEHGFHTQINIGEKIALIHSELSEALEAVRKNNLPDSHIPEFSGAEAELADAIIRIMDLAKINSWCVAEAVIAKMAYNKNRPYKHGGKNF